MRFTRRRTAVAVLTAGLLGAGGSPAALAGTRAEPADAATSVSAKRDCRKQGISVPGGRLHYEECYRGSGVAVRGTVRDVRADGECAHAVVVERSRDRFPACGNGEGASFSVADHDVDPRVYLEVH